MHDIQIVIFSKDRPLQLDGTLKSLKRHCHESHSLPMRVLYKTSTSRQRSLYRQLIYEHPNVQFIEELDFHRDTQFLLSLHEFVLFVVDDTVFVDNFSLSEFAEALNQRAQAIGVSLRLGLNTTYCYTLNKSQSVPVLRPFTASLFEFSWLNAECDFGYPLEISSSLYRAADLQKLLIKLPFHNPNTLEAVLANQAKLLQKTYPILLCPSQSLAFSIPVNLVQDVCPNRVSDRLDLSASVLSDKFAHGWRIDVTQFDGFIPTGCHQEVELPIIRTASVIPVVSVVIPCYKQAEFLRESVESVIAQTFVDWEIIIVDDGSPDATTSIAQAIITKYTGQSIKLLQKRNNEGLSEARNDGIRIARGAYILPLDADDLLKPTMLEKTVRLLDSNPDIAIAYTDITHFGVVNCTIQAAEYDAKKILVNNQLNYCSLYRYEVWENTGGYRSLYWGYEDWDFWVGCVTAGFQAARVPEALLLYRVKKESMYRSALAHDSELRARIVLNHPELYPLRRVSTARKIVAEHPTPLLPNAPLVSIIVPTYNRPNSLCTALRSILAQTMQDFEIIVVNDAGVDITSWIKNLDRLGRIRILNHSYTRGVAAARNTGLRSARGQYISYLDDDDIFYPNHLELLVKAVKKSHGSVAFSNSYEAIYSQHNEETSVKKNIVYSGKFELKDLLVCNRIPVLCILHQRSCIDTIGEFDEKLTTHEDWDMWIRLFHHFQYIHVNQTTCEYKVQRNKDSLTSTKRKDFYRTMKIIHARYKKLSPYSHDIKKRQSNVLLKLEWELFCSGSPATIRSKFFYSLRLVSPRFFNFLKRKIILTRSVLMN